MNRLNDPITLNNGVVIPNRIVMAPMTTKGSHYNGTVGKEDYEFFSRRSEAAGIIITGATAVSKLGENFSYQMSIYDDRFVPGLTELAKNMKRHGNKILVQIYHSGANSKTSYEKHGKVVAPSNVNFPHLPYQVTELSEAEIWEVIKDFGRGTKRVIESGFDGVEIHGAYKHIIQQFFSTYSNKRKDHWGGTLEKRMNFALEVIKEVQKTAKKYADKNFIIGYRLTEEEMHKDSVGYDIHDTLKLIDKLADTNLDYIHVTSNRFGKQIKNVIKDRTVFIYVPEDVTPKAAEDGLEFGDMVSLARGMLIEPDFAKKIIDGKEAEVATKITSVEMARSLHWPMKMAEWLLDPNGRNAVPKGIEFFKDTMEKE